MDMPKQMGAGTGEQPRQRQQGDADETKTRRSANKAESVQRDDDQQVTTQFSDWASI